MKTSSAFAVVLTSSLSLTVASIAAQDKTAKPAPAPAKPTAAPSAAPPATAPGATATPPTEAPKPAPEFVDYMKDMLGNWTCETTYAAGSFAPGSPEIKTTSKVKISKGEPMLAGFFYRGEYTVPKSKDIPMAMTGIFYLGFEPTSKMVLSVGVDNMGGASMSTGSLIGAVASWTGEAYMMGKKMKIRESFTKTGPKQMSHKYEADMGKGFQPMGEDVCKK